MRSALAPSALLLALLTPYAAVSQISVAINIRPPELPVYVQPPVPGDGYLWTPGYWGWNDSDNDYFWVPGTWVLPPTVGVLWTPGYWGFQSGGYRWRAGYWGPRVGFYGGISYGHGYTGNGYHGGRWNRGAFQYNTSVNNVDKVVVRNVYNTTVVNNYNVKRVSFNGGPDGVKAEPTANERKEQQARHVDPTPNQVQHERTAMATPAQKASVNRGNPPVGATARPSQFDGQDKKRNDDDGSGAAQAQKKTANERRQAQAADTADAPQGKGDGKGRNNEQKQDAVPASPQLDDAQPAPRDNAARRAQRAEAQPPQDASDSRTDHAKPKNEPRSQKQAEPQLQQDPQPKRQSQQQQRQDQQPEPQQKQQPKQQGKAQGESGKEKAGG